MKGLRMNGLVSSRLQHSETKHATVEFGVEQSVCATLSDDRTEGPTDVSDPPLLVDDPGAEPAPSRKSGGEFRKL